MGEKASQQLPFHETIINTLRISREEEDHKMATKFVYLALLTEVPEEYAEEVFAEIEETITWIEESYISDLVSNASEMRELLGLVRSSIEEAKSENSSNTDEVETADGKESAEAEPTEEKSEPEGASSMG